MHAIHQEFLPPSAVEFAAQFNFTPSTLSDASLLSQPGCTHLNAVVTRSNLPRIFEVREEPVPASVQKDHEKERLAVERNGTEAVEGEVKMDPCGEGFVNMGAVKVNFGNHFCCAVADHCKCHHTFAPPR